jgi:hypothetical protein
VPEFKDLDGTTAWQPMPDLIGDGERRVITDPQPAATGRIYRIRVE